MSVISESVGIICFDLDDNLCVVLTSQTKKSFK